MKGIVYYTDNRLGEPIQSAVQRELLRAGLPITSVTLKPTNFGDNIVLDLEPNIVTMYKQILTGLEASKAEIVFLCEHDVLYHKTHFDFIPSKDIFYYNTNVWWWEYPKDKFVGFDYIKSQSGLCAYRDLLLRHYTKRLKLIEDNGWDKQLSREPKWARRMGYEPATKSERQEIVSKEGFMIWQSDFPNIDVRHNKTLTPRKTTLKEFKHAPNNWRETTMDKISGWNLKL